jgi:hypothetical protein
MKTNDLILKDLRPYSDVLESIQQHYHKASADIETIFFYEEYEAETGGGKKDLVGLWQSTTKERLMSN